MRPDQLALCRVEIEARAVRKGLGRLRAAVVALRTVMAAQTPTPAGESCWCPLQVLEGQLQTNENVMASLAASARLRREARRGPYDGG